MVVLRGFMVHLAVMRDHVMLKIEPVSAQLIDPGTLSLSLSDHCSSTCVVKSRCILLVFVVELWK